MAICHLHDQIFILADFETKKFGRESEKSAKNFYLKIGRNENFSGKTCFKDPPQN